MKAVVLAVELVGLAAIVCGVLLWSLPAALIVAGVGLLVAAWRLDEGQT